MHSIRCGLLLYMFRGLPVCVCCSWAWTLQKRMNRSRCRLGAALRGPREPCIRWDTYWRHLANTIEWSVRGVDAALREITLTACHSIAAINHGQNTNRLDGHYLGIACTAVHIVLSIRALHALLNCDMQQVDCWHFLCLFITLFILFSVAICVMLAT